MKILPSRRIIDWNHWKLTKISILIWQNIPNDQKVEASKCSILLLCKFRIGTWWISEFTYTENSRMKAILIISQNHFLLQFRVVNSYSNWIHIFPANPYELTPKLAIFSLKIMNNGENCLSLIWRFTQMVKSKITFMLNSQKFWS